LVPADSSRIRLGILRLTDAAPLIVAHEFGFFADEGLEVSLSVEPSWANIADKVAYGLLDGAMMLPALALASSLGLRGPGLPFVVPMSLSLNGNTVTFGTALAEEVLGTSGLEGALTIGRRLKRALEEREEVARFGVVHPFSSHNLLLRYWLTASGIDPDRDLAFDVIPPARMVEALRSGRIVGFCAGAPWGEIARRSLLGRTALPSAAIWRNHPEKIFAVGRRFAERHPVRLAALVRALLRAARHCDDPAQADAVATLVAGSAYLDVDPAAVRASLPGTGGGNESFFFRCAATYPWRSHAAWFVAEMTRWGYLPRALETAQSIAEIYRPDIYAAAAADIGLPVPASDRKIEGAHDGNWLLAAGIGDIEMERDRFCDGRPFDPTASGAVGGAAINS
jgi:NitT/TauT family transport system ATP-binding protein/nitrate/nitrite transport system substrate-binding protein